MTLRKRRLRKVLIAVKVPTFLDGISIYPTGDVTRLFDLKLKSIQAGNKQAFFKVIEYI